LLSASLAALEPYLESCIKKK